MGKADRRSPTSCLEASKANRLPRMRDRGRIGGMIWNKKVPDPVMIFLAGAISGWILSTCVYVLGSISDWRIPMLIVEWTAKPGIVLDQWLYPRFGDDWEPFPGGKLGEASVALFYGLISIAIWWVIRKIRSRLFDPPNNPEPAN